MTEIKSGDRVKLTIEGVISHFDKDEFSIKLDTGKYAYIETDSPSLLGDGFKVERVAERVEDLAPKLKLGDKIRLLPGGSAEYNYETIEFLAFERLNEQAQNSSTVWTGRLYYRPVGKNEAGSILITGVDRLEKV